VPVATPGSGRHGRPGGRPSGTGAALAGLARLAERRWVRAAGGAGLTAVALAAIMTAMLARGGPHPDPAAAAGQAGVRPAEPQQPVALTFCPARPGQRLRAALDRAVPGSRSAEIQPLGVSGSGQVAYVSAWTSGFSGVAALNLATGKLHPIRAFASPATDQADGTSGGGRWLVWAQTYSLASLDRFTMYAWDSATGRLETLGRSIAGPGGKPWPSPWHAPAVSGHYAAWAQGYGPGGRVEIRLADLDTGQVTTIRTGHTQPPLFDGGLVVWPESDAPGTQTTLRAYSPAARHLVPLPAALRAVHGTEFVVTDGTRTAYLSPGLTELYYSPRQDQPARPALRLPAGVDFADLAMAPGSLAWTTSRATYLASTRTGAYTKVTARYGYATGSGSVLLVTDAPSQKQVHPPLALHVIDPGGISWPQCRSRVAG
jgi:hypothetical protein